MQLITSRENKIIKNVLKLINSPKERREQEKFVIEGIRLCTDAFESGVLINTVFVCESAKIKFSDFVSKLEGVCESTFLLSDKLFSQISDTKTPQGIMCICCIQKQTFDFKKGFKYLALESVQDPSNMGTVLRTAEALGINGVIINNMCCDIYSPKVLRGSMGAIFRLPILLHNDFSVLIKELNSQNITTLASVVYNTNKISDLTEEEKHTSVIFIGNEGNGLSENVIKNCKKTVTIPMKGRAESLNASVAASILMWELLK